VNDVRTGLMLWRAFDKTLEVAAGVCGGCGRASPYGISIMCKGVNPTKSNSMQIEFR
jgi:hypothetical protein